MVALTSASFSKHIKNSTLHGFYSASSVIQRFLLKQTWKMELKIKCKYVVTVVIKGCVVELVRATSWYPVWWDLLNGALGLMRHIERSQDT